MSLKAEEICRRPVFIEIKCTWRIVLWWEELQILTALQRRTTVDVWEKVWADLQLVKTNPAQSGSSPDHDQDVCVICWQILKLWVLVLHHSVFTGRLWLIVKICASFCKTTLRKSIVNKFLLKYGKQSKELGLVFIFMSCFSFLYMSIQCVCSEKGSCSNKPLQETSEKNGGQGSNWRI